MKNPEPAMEAIVPSSAFPMSDNASIEISCRISKDRSIPGEVLTAFEFDTVREGDDTDKILARLLCLEIQLTRSPDVEKDLKAKYAYNLQENTKPGRAVKAEWEKKSVSALTSFESTQNEQPKLFYQVFSLDIKDTSVIPRTRQGEFGNAVRSLPLEKQNRVYKFLREFDVSEGLLKRNKEILDDFFFKNGYKVQVKNSRKRMGADLDIKSLYSCCHGVQTIVTVSKPKERTSKSMNPLSQSRDVQGPSHSSTNERDNDNLEHVSKPGTPELEEEDYSDKLTEERVQSDQYYHKGDENIFQDCHVNANVDVRSNTTNESERDESAHLASIDEHSPPASFVPGYADKTIGRGSSHSKRRRQELMILSTNDEDESCLRSHRVGGSQEKSPFRSPSPQISDAHTGMVNETKSSSFLIDVKDSMELREDHSYPSPEVNQIVNGNFASLESNRPGSLSSWASGSNILHNDNGHYPYSPDATRNPDQFYVKNENANGHTPVFDRIRQDGQHYLPRRQRITDHIAYPQYPSQNGYRSQSLRSPGMYGDNGVHEHYHMNRNRYGKLERALPSASPTLHKQESFTSCNTRHPVNSAFRNDMPSTSVESLLDTLGDIFHRSHYLMSVELAKTYNLRLAIMNELSGRVWDLVKQEYGTYLSEHIANMRIEANAHCGLQRYVNSMEVESTATASVPDDRVIHEMWLDINNDPRVLNERLDQKDKPMQEPLLEKMQGLTLHEMELRVQDDCSAKETGQATVPSTTHSTAGAVAPTLAQEPKVVPLTKKEVEKKSKSSIKKKILGCFSFNGSRRETSINNQAAAGATKSTADSPQGRNQAAAAAANESATPAQLQSFRKQASTLPDMKRYITLDSDSGRWLVQIWDAEYQGYRPLGHFMDEVAARVAHDIYAMKLQYRRVTPMPTLYYPRKDYSDVLKRYIYSTSPSKLRSELRNSSMTLFNLPIWKESGETTVNEPSAPQDM